MQKKKVFFLFIMIQQTKKFSLECCQVFFFVLLMGNSCFILAGMCRKRQDRNYGRCSLCLEDMICDNNKYTIWRAVCRHYFHMKCMAQWCNAQLASHGHVTCPLCRASVITAEDATKPYCWKPPVSCGGSGIMYAYTPSWFPL